MNNKLGKRQVNIVGHPGTGKTTKLGELVYNYVKDNPEDYGERVLGANFSRSAAHALKKSLGSHGMNMGDFKHFRTIHSLAAKVLDLKNVEQFVQPSDCLSFFNEYRIQYEGKNRTIDDIDLYGYVGEPVSIARGNQILGYFQYLKVYVFLMLKMSQCNEPLSVLCVSYNLIFHNLRRSVRLNL
ncbi:unnamed protein product [marine sediment metagenome]|uniref:Uncharacterized protein n=1 Tax=marine sediment metagenome TaxID=412755 RepID=X1HSL0_9ZZZZ